MCSPYPGNWTYQVNIETPDVCTFLDGANQQDEADPRFYLRGDKAGTCRLTAKMNGAEREGSAEYTLVDR